MRMKINGKEHDVTRGFEWYFESERYRAWAALSGDRVVIGLAGKHGVGMDIKLDEHSRNIPLDVELNVNFVETRVCYHLENGCKHIMVTHDGGIHWIKNEKEFSIPLSSLVILECDYRSME